jgi:hypothetical protein
VVNADTSLRFETACSASIFVAFAFEAAEGRQQSLHRRMYYIERARLGREMDRLHDTPRVARFGATGAALFPSREQCAPHFRREFLTPFVHGAS